MTPLYLKNNALYVFLRPNELNPFIGPYKTNTNFESSYSIYPSLIS